jgi:hypothetical protein
LPGVIDARRLRQRGFRPEVHHVCALRGEHLTALDRAFRSEANALAIPRIGGEIHHAHDGGLGIEGEGFAAEGKFLHPGQGRAILASNSARCSSVSTQRS